MITIPPSAINIIKSFEGFHPHAYVCSGGKLTIGYGHVIRQGEDLTYITEDHAVDLLHVDAAWAANAVDRLVYVPLGNFGRAALISLVFNIGSGNFQGSTIRMRLNRGDYNGAADIFWQWRRANGIVLLGLVRRRSAEKSLFLI